MSWLKLYLRGISATKDADPLRFRRGHLLFFLLIALGGITASCLSFWVWRERELAVARNQFLDSAKNRADAVHYEAVEQLNVTNMLVAFFAGSEVVTRGEFHTFTKSLLDENDTTLVLGWAPRIRGAERRRYEQAVRGDGFPKYEITERDKNGKFIPAASRAEYCPICYMEPLKKDLSLLGLDLRAMPGCRDAIRRAMATNRPATGVCGPLCGDAADRVLLYVVAPARNESPDPANRPADHPMISGFVFGLFRVDAIMALALKPWTASGIDVSVVAPSDAGGDRVIYPGPSAVQDRKAAEPAQNSSTDLHSPAEFEVADRRWKFDCVATSAFWNRRRTWEPTIALLAGLLVAGFLAGYLFLLGDHTARVEQLVAEKTRELHESEQRFRLLVDNAGDAFFLHTRQGKILDVNPWACESLGYTREELLSMTIADIDADYTARNIPRHWEYESEAYPVSFEGVQRRKDGTTFPVEVRLNLLNVGGQRLLLGLARDISERKQLQRTLQEDKLKFSAILNQTFQFIGLMTPDGILIEANQSALTFGGVSLADVRDKPLWETPWWSHSQEMRQKLQDSVKSAAQGNFIRMEMTNRAANGEIHWIDFSLKPVKDETGKVLFLIPEGRDITERKQMEEALNKEQQLLRNLLGLQEQDRKLVSYEIHDGLAQQLVGALYKFQSIDYLRDRDPDAARQMFDEAVRLLREAMAETRRLISGLRPPILDEAGVVDAVNYLISEQRQRGGPEIEFVYPEEFGCLASPLESAIYRVVQECLTNAYRYSQSEKVRVELRQTADRVHVEVRDWGIGFDPARVGHGHYGLQGIRERARLLRGAASIETAPGKGTCVSVEFPRLLPMENGTEKNGIEPQMDVD